MTGVDAVVVGGGFFGCAIACHLKARMGRVMLIEQDRDLFQRASYSNQARIHSGYHYPRSLMTAYRSRVNFEKFAGEYPECVVRDFTKIYCIGKTMSKVSPRHFERFCAIIGAPLRRARKEHAALFDARLIAAVYEVEEYAFDSTVLREIMRRRLEAAGVEVRLATRVDKVEVRGKTPFVALSDGSTVQSRYVFSCTYAGIKRIPGLGRHCRTALKQEIAEMALIEPPEEIRELGITVMCGPFFSTMPFPPRKLHTLSHVRYTPHCSWMDDGGHDVPSPYDAMRDYAGGSRSSYMLHDAARYLPVLAQAKVVDSLFEVKTLLVRSEVDDGRPILMERSETAPAVFSILGGKLDNIYDVIQRLEAEEL